MNCLNYRDNTQNMRMCSKQLLWVFLMSAILIQLMGCSMIPFMPTQILRRPTSSFYDQMMDFKSSLKSDPYIGNLQATYDSNYGDYTTHWTYQENYQLNGKFKGRRFSLYQSRTERREYREPEWIPLRTSRKGNKNSEQWVFVQTRRGYWGTRTYHHSTISISVSPAFEAKISGEGFFTWIRKKILQQKEVTIGIASIDQTYFVKSDEEGMVKRFLKDPGVQKNIEVLKKDNLLPLEISNNEIKIEKSYKMDRTEITRCLSALSNIASVLERVSYLEMPDGLP